MRGWSRRVNSRPRNSTYHLVWAGYKPAQENSFVGTIQRIVVPLALVIGILSVVLVLNITAPNPTARRYSSEMPLTMGRASASQIGLDGERILANDLHLPRNDAPDQLQCICSSLTLTDPKNCRACIVAAPIAGVYRRPDFIGPDFIAESKNARNLLYESRDLGEISDYSVAARALQRPLWVFTRINTNIDPEFIRIVRTTGGDVVPYFTIPGYVDPVDQIAKTVLVGSIVVIVVTQIRGQGQRIKIGENGSQEKLP
jgi:hypothetical protein